MGRPFFASTAFNQIGYVENRLGSQIHVLDDMHPNSPSLARCSAGRCSAANKPAEPSCESSKLPDSQLEKLPLRVAFWFQRIGN